MIAGWHQWADAGEVSSGLPQYLVEMTQAEKIGELKPGGYYLFQVPGTHYFLRPVVKLDEGHREEMAQRKNELFFAGDDQDGLFIFLGNEPHLNEERYAEAFLDMVETLNIERVAALAGVYGAVPHAKDRNISSVYSLPEMKEELSQYAVRFSGYEGGTTISMYLAHRAEFRDIGFFRFCAFVPSYDLSQLSSMAPSVAIERDYKSWYDIMIRLKYMFDLSLDLSDLEERSDALISAWNTKIGQMIQSIPQLKLQNYMEEVEKEFTEMPFEPLSDVWTEALDNLFDDV
jgi:hypothetical protein